MEQEPFLISDTVTANITFGSAFDSSKFNEVVERACLLPDLDILAHGADTMLGEKGVNISGG